MFGTLRSISSNRLLAIYQILLVQKLSAQADNTQTPSRKQNLKSPWKPARKPEHQVHLQPGYPKSFHPGYP